MMNKIVCNAVVAACVMLLGGLLCLVVNAAQQQLPAEPDIAWSDFIAAVGSRDPMNANHVLEYYTWAIRQDNAWFEQCVAISVDNRFDAWSTNGVSAQTNMTEFVAQYEAFKLEVNASIRQTDSNVSVNNGRVQVLRYDVNRLQTDVTDTRNSVQQLMTETMDSQNALMQMLEQRVNELAARDISIGTDVCRMIDQLRRRHTSAFNFVNARIYCKTNFFDFINRYRIEEFKIQSILKANNHLSIMGIAYNCGFNSKASFYRAFKKFEGISPTDYIERSHKK